MGEFHIKYHPELMHKKEDNSYWHLLVIGAMVIMIIIITQFG